MIREYGHELRNYTDNCEQAMRQIQKTLNTINYNRRPELTKKQLPLNQIWAMQI